MRLDRYLSHAAGLTRSEAQRAVRAGRVAVDGARVRDAALRLADGAAVVLDGVAVVERGPRYFMLHKPAGCVCATSDGVHPTVLELVPEAERDGLHVVGRLDLDVTGLVLLTDDGEWSHRVTAPRRKCPKTYLAELAEPLAEAAAASLRAGVRLRGEERETRPAAVETVGDRRVRITVTEGRYHQVKRMLAAVGNRVLTLHRERVGPVDLDPSLGPGAWRSLTAEEVAGLGDCSG
ncbi:MAG: 16S rRNA pseudouridine(516) synthase RsuA [Gammaproteobacteria bacterium]|jgi:16S rRNA pseudouridine516 synthase|nr:16S rRNA pseudouridine(516) synthase RsuA [Gammaproteobacteria bacterium]